MARPLVLSNVGTARLLESNQTVGKTFEVIPGQHIWVVREIPDSGHMYFEQEFVDDDGRLWVPLYEFSASDMITKGSIGSGSLQLEIAGGRYRITASAAGGQSWCSRLGTPFP